MSYRATGWAYDLPLAGAKKFVLVALADMADEAGSCFPGQERLVEMTGLSIRTVRRALESLERTGLLVRESRHDVRGYRTSDRYYLQLTVRALPDVTAPAVEAEAPGPGAQPVDNPPTGQNDRRSSGPGLPAIVTTPTGHGDRAMNHQGNHQENHQGGAPATPTCGKHPAGTNAKCRACGDARRLFDAARAQPQPPAPAVARYDFGIYCPHLQLRTSDCDACAYEARAALERAGYALETAS